MPVPTTDKFTQIDVAAHSGAFGDNPLPLPSDSKIEAGNYKKGKFKLHGLTVSIEQPKNSYRTGVDKNGKRWTNRLAANYGYINGTKGNDNDPVDCFIGSYPQSDTVYIINQFVNGVFDEHKVMLCYPAESFARCDYEMSYSRDWNGLHSIVTATIKQFKQWLKNGDMTKPLAASDLPITEIEQMQRIQWDENGLPKNTSVAKIIYDLRKTDDGGQLLDSITVDDIYHDYGKLFDSSETAYLDSLNIPFGAIYRTANIIKRELNKKGTKLQVKEPLEGENPNPFISEPFKQNGVAMVSMLFTLSDGQSIKIFFHDPNPASNKMDKADIIIAWKWMLNKKDITILVSPELGQDVKLATIAQRIMTMAEGNMEAFARANKNLAEQIKQVNELETEINSLSMVLQAKQGEFETVKAKYDDWLVNKATNPEPAPVVTPENGFTPTHKYHDADIGEDVLVRFNEESGNWEDANDMQYMDIDSEVEPITGEQVAAVSIPEKIAGIGVGDRILTKTDGIKYAEVIGIEKNTNGIENYAGGDFVVVYKTDDTNSRNGNTIYRVASKIFEQSVNSGMIEKIISDEPTKQPEPQPEPVVTPEPTTTQGIDPVAKANIEAANISAAIKKKAIAFLNANPATHSFEGSGLSKPSQKAIMESIKTALFAEIKALSPLFVDFNGGSSLGNGVSLKTQDNEKYGLTITVNDDYKLSFWVLDNGNVTEIFDSTQTLEDLRSWGFALPFDLDVKAFVANVIKPVVDEFLSKQGSGESVESDDGKKDRYPASSLSKQAAVPATEPEPELVSRILSDIEILKKDVVDGKFDSPEHYISNYNQIEDRVIAANLGNNEKLIDAFRQLSDAWDANKMKNSFPDTPIPEPQPPVEETPTNTFDADIEALRSETDYIAFDAKLDELAGKIEEAGLMEQYEPQLNELADLLTELLKKAAA